MPPIVTVGDALAALRDENRIEEHDEAGDVICGLGPEDSDAIPELLHDFRDETSHGRFWILYALEQITPQNPAVFNVIAAYSRDPDEHLRGEVIRYLDLYGANNRSVTIPALARAAQLRPAQDYVSNACKAFSALVRLAGWKGALNVLQKERQTG